MVEKLKLELVTPSKKVLSEEVDEITASGALGEFGVLPGHARFLTSLKIGGLSYQSEGTVHHLAVSRGYLEVEDDKVTVMVETAEPADEIDLQRAKAAQGRAEEALKRLNPEHADYGKYQAALERAQIRVQVAGKAGKK